MELLTTFNVIECRLVLAVLLPEKLLPPGWLGVEVGAAGGVGG